MREPAPAPSYSLGFADLRRNFQLAARRANAELFEYPHPLHGPDGETLATDGGSFRARVQAKPFAAVDESRIGSRARTTGRRIGGATRCIACPIGNGQARGMQFAELPSG